MTPPPPAHGPRVEWRDIPLLVRNAIEERLGSTVVSAVNQQGGFSPGLAARIVTASGSRAFVKAAGPELNSDTPIAFRREAEIVAALPAAVPAPRLRWSYEDVESGWVVLVFEDIDGRMPTVPWVPKELDRVLDALEQLHALLTPAPIDVVSAEEAYRDVLNGWGLLAQSTLPGLDGWSRKYLPELVALEQLAPQACAGNTLLHFDLRADNILLTDHRVYFVDWPWASKGASFVDLVAMAPSVAMQGGPAPEELIERFAPARDADPDKVTAFIASIAGFFIHRSLQPPPPGLPTLRAFQAAQGEIARRWVVYRTGWL